MNSCTFVDSADANGMRESGVMCENVRSESDAYGDDDDYDADDEKRRTELMTVADSVQILRAPLIPNLMPAVAAIDCINVDLLQVH